MCIYISQFDQPRTPPSPAYIRYRLLAIQHNAIVTVTAAKTVTAATAATIATTATAAMTVLCNRMAVQASSAIIIEEEAGWLR
jgi:hypothetical protein